MKIVRIVILSILLLYCFSHSKNTYSAFSLGFALPMSSSAIVDTIGGTKELGAGWDAGWTFFGFPFAKSESALSGLALGGKISFSRWVRDSTFNELTFLGKQGIIRYYTPLNIKPFDLFVQAGAGMFIGEHGFTDPDTIPAFPAPAAFDRIVTEGKKNIGVSINIGVDWDVFEVSPGITIVLTQEKSSAWISINAAMKF